MKRRMFLSNLITSPFLIPTTGLGLLSPLQLLAQMSRDPHFFVFVQIENGWDVTLSLDPKTHEGGIDQNDLFIEYSPSEILGTGQLMLGPAAQGLIPHIEDLHVIRGIEMRRDGGHLTNLEIISSGVGDGSASILPAQVALMGNIGDFGVMVDNTLSSRLSGVPVSNFDTIQISNTTSNRDFFFDPENSFSSFEKAETSLQQRFKKQEEMNRLITTLNSEYGITDQALVSMMVAFATGGSNQACLAIEADLDSHADHEGNHLREQTQAWDQVANIFNGFKSFEFRPGKSLFDFTTFMVVSEFSRTPYLNGARGKDHNPHANSVLLAGKNVNGGSYTGGSQIIPRDESRYGRSEHIGEAIDYKTGQIIQTVENQNEDVHLVFPENLAATVRKIFGNSEDQALPNVIKS